MLLIKSIANFIQFKPKQIFGFKSLFQKFSFLWQGKCVILTTFTVKKQKRVSLLSNLEFINKFNNANSYHNDRIGFHKILTVSNKKYINKWLRIKSKSPRLKKKWTDLWLRKSWTLNFKWHKAKLQLSKLRVLKFKTRNLIVNEKKKIKNSKYKYNKVRYNKMRTVSNTTLFFWIKHFFKSSVAFKQYLWMQNGGLSFNQILYYLQNSFKTQSYTFRTLSRLSVKYLAPAPRRQMGGVNYTTFNVMHKNRLPFWNKTELNSSKVKTDVKNWIKRYPSTVNHNNSIGRLFNNSKHLLFQLGIPVNFYKFNNLRLSVNKNLWVIKKNIAVRQIHKLRYKFYGKQLRAKSSREKLFMFSPTRLKKNIYRRRLVFERKFRRVIRKKGYKYKSLFWIKASLFERKKMLFIWKKRYYIRGCRPYAYLHKKNKLFFNWGDKHLFSRAPIQRYKYPVLFFFPRFANYRRLYKNQLREQHIFRWVYRLKFSQLIKRFRKSIKSTKRIFELVFLQYFEFRLDTIVYRLNFVYSIKQGRQLVNRGFFMINNEPIHSYTYHAKFGDVIMPIKKFRLMGARLRWFKPKEQGFRFMNMRLFYRPLQIDQYPNHFLINERISAGLIMKSIDTTTLRGNRSYSIQYLTLSLLKYN